MRDCLHVLCYGPSECERFACIVKDCHGMYFYCRIFFLQFEFPIEVHILLDFGHCIRHETCPLTKVLGEWSSSYICTFFHTVQHILVFKNNPPDRLLHCIKVVPVSSVFRMKKMHQPSHWPLTDACSFWFGVTFIRIVRRSLNRQSPVLYR